MRAALGLLLVAACAQTGPSREVIGLEEEMLSLVNELRAAGGSCPSFSFEPVPPLSMEERLRSAARAHSSPGRRGFADSQDMADKDYFAHVGEDGRTPDQRAADEGYDFARIAENIAAGNRSPRETFESAKPRLPGLESAKPRLPGLEQWLDSDPHCANMVDPALEELGVGYARAEDEADPLVHYWTQLFGAQ